MKKIILCILVIFIFKIIVDAQIIDKKNYTFSDEMMKRITTVIDNEKKYLPKYQYLGTVKMYEITYLSEGLKVKGYLAHPSEKGVYPCIIFNRGGNREFGSLNEKKMVHILAAAANWGYVVIAGNYRGNGGGEGVEEFGGADVKDVINLIPALESLEIADASRIGMYGWSRGGMMTYLALKQTDRIKAAVVGGALSDSFKMIESRPGMEDVYRELVPNYRADRKRVLTERSPVLWADKLPKTTPILILHGTADWRVVPEMAIEMSAALLKAKHPFRLLLLEGGDHGLTEHSEKVAQEVREWFDRYVANESPLPNLKPHGR
jgi:dipeptidyl aminopeptidase/acylaminoacyl peptidase